MPGFFAMMLVIKVAVVHPRQVARKICKRHEGSKPLGDGARDRLTLRVAHYLVLSMGERSISIPLIFPPAPRADVKISSPRAMTSMKSTL